MDWLIKLLGGVPEADCARERTGWDATMKDLYGQVDSLQATLIKTRGERDEALASLGMADGIGEKWIEHVKEIVSWIDARGGGLYPVYSTVRLDPKMLAPGYTMRAFMEPLGVVVHVDGGVRVNDLTLTNLKESGRYRFDGPAAIAAAKAEVFDRSRQPASPHLRMAVARSIALRLDLIQEWIDMPGMLDLDRFGLPFPWNPPLMFSDRKCAFSVDVLIGYSLPRELLFNEPVDLKITLYFKLLGEEKKPLLYEHPASA